MISIPSTAEELRQLQQRTLNRLGVHLFRGTDAWMARASLVSGGPVYDNAQFPWTTQLEASAPEIRRELEKILTFHEKLPTFQDLSPAQKVISKDDGWRIFALYGFGKRSDRNCQLCPATARVLDGIPGVFNAFFSILAPRKTIPRHCGITRGFLRCHLGLVIPTERERCRMDVDGSPVVWEENKAVVFDDSRPHQVWNDTDERRVVLLIDVPRPMKLEGRLLLAGLMGVLRQTYYVREPIANQRRWERQTQDLFAR